MTEAPDTSTKRGGGSARGLGSRLGGVALLFNVIIIASIVWLGPVFGVTAVAWGTTGAMAAQAIMQFVVLRLRGFRWRARLDWHDPRLGRPGMTAVAGGAVYGGASALLRVPAGQLLGSCCVER